MQSTSSRRPPRDGNVVKKLKPGAPGTLRWLERYGDTLLCVRYRLDEELGRRYTTVEILVDDRAIQDRAKKHEKQVLIRVGYGELDTQQIVKAAGGVWNPKERLWKLPKHKVVALKMQRRIVKNVD